MRDVKALHPDLEEKNCAVTEKMCRCRNHYWHWRVFENESRAGCFIRTGKDNAGKDCY